MKTTIILIATIMIGTIAVKAQSFWTEDDPQKFWTEHDVRISEYGKAIVYSQVQYTYQIGESGFAVAPYISSNYKDWHEGLIFANYRYDVFAGGIGAGVEILNNKTSFRWSPWIQASPMIYDAESGVLDILSQWEFGKGKNNYWYSNSIIYKARTEDDISGQFGLLARRFYGIGPIGGLTWREDKLFVSINIAVLRDIEFNTVNFVPMLTIGFW